MPRRAVAKRSMRVLGTGQSLTRPATQPPRQSERSFQAQVLAYATLRGWRAYHTHDSRHSASGFPDLVLVRRPYVLFVELKRDGERPTGAQQAWLDALIDCGLDASVWHPLDWPELERRLR